MDAVRATQELRISTCGIVKPKAPSFTQTTMSNYPRLPQELLDLIVDILHDDPELLKQCCLVSKSWIPRSRKHLFARVEILRVRDLLWWDKLWPDPADSPAFHTRTMVVRGSFGGLGRTNWIHAFSRIERLIVEYGYFCFTTRDSLVPFHILARSLKSLRVNFIKDIQHSQVFGLIRSLLLLEDLTLCGSDTSAKDWRPKNSHIALLPLTSPALTGTLELSLKHMKRSLRLLLDLPGGLHFRKVTLNSPCSEDSYPLAVQLVTACSNTLERLNIGCTIEGTLNSVSSFGQIFP